jgi:pyrroloquinoline quinone (PQQ) biosynthesis protein C
MNNSQSQLSLKAYVFLRTKQLLKSCFILRMKQSNVSLRIYELWVKERSMLSSNFVSLLKQCLPLLRGAGHEFLYNALEVNLYDEIGLIDGVLQPQQSHAFLKTKYLEALGIDYHSIHVTQLLASTQYHSHQLLDLEASGDTFKICGSLLMMENFIPHEYRAAQASRNYLFPELFVIDEHDSAEVREEKRACSRYIDDHITHDAHDHFPQLLSALEPFYAEEKYRTDIQSGIDLIYDCRQFFYNEFDKLIA